MVMLEECAGGLALRGGGCARCGVLTWERWHGEGGGAKVTGVHGWEGYHRELPPGWGHQQARTRDEDVFHKEIKYASVGGIDFGDDFPGYRQ